MIEPMHDPDEIADLKKCVNALERQVKFLVLANMKLINAHVGLIKANALKTEYIVSNKREDVQDNYFQVSPTYPSILIKYSNHEC